MSWMKKIFGTARDESLEALIEKAEAGDVAAQFLLGEMYAGGKGVAKNETEALKWFRRSAEAGNPDAQFLLGMMYDIGRGVEQDYEEAAKWLRLAAEAGFAAAQFNLGQMYAHGRGVPQDYAEAVKWYRPAAEAGVAEAQYNLGVMYDEGKGVAQDYVEAVKWWHLAAEAGVAEAQSNLGAMYGKGEGVAQDDVEAAKWYSLAAEAGVADAQFNLGFMHAEGRGVAQDFLLAYMWFNLAATQGNKDAKEIYDGIASLMTSEQITKAKEMVRQHLAGEVAGGVENQNNVTKTRDESESVSQDSTEADFQKGVDAYKAGDYATALAVFTSLAEAGNAPAQCYLGIIYAEGKGVEEDRAIALMWLILAAVEGNEEARINLIKLKNSMTPEEITEATEMVRQHRAGKMRDASKSVSQDSTEADFKKGRDAYRAGDYATALAVFTSLAEAGNVQAQFNLGKMYAIGQGVSWDIIEAEKWYRRAADGGHAIAQLNLEIIHQDAKTSPDDAEAVGEAEGQNIMGELYEDGNKYIEQDYAEAVKCYRLAAEAGYAEAQFNLGRMYYGGKGVAQDNCRAYMWFSLAADQEFELAREILEEVIGLMTPEQIAEAKEMVRQHLAGEVAGGVENQNNVTKMRDESESVSQDSTEADFQKGEDSFDALIKKAEAGDAEAQNNLGGKYIDGDGVPQNYTEAVKWIRLAAEAGFALAQFNLGNMYFFGKCVAQDDVEAVKWWRLAAGAGSAGAQNKLGLMYDDGRGVEQDYAEAIKWYRLAAKAGNAEAQFNLGEMYDGGKGVSQDTTEAIKWYHLAADGGLPIAQYNLGVIYQSGEGVAQDDAEAVKWFRLAAEAGYPEAQNNLAVMYYHGRGVEQDYAEAAKWWHLAAEAGVTSSQYSLGGIYRDGNGVPQDYAEAAKRFRLAAEAGHAVSQAFLGAMYVEGMGVAQDNIFAYMWLSLAYAQEVEIAKEGRVFAANNMTPEQFAEAEKMTKEMAEKIAKNQQKKS